MPTKLMTVSVDYRVPLDRAIATAVRKGKLKESGWLLRDWQEGRILAETKENELSMVNLSFVKPEGETQMQEMCMYLRRSGIRLATVRELLELAEKPYSKDLEKISILALGTITTKLNVPALEFSKDGTSKIIPRKFSDSLLICDRILVFGSAEVTEF